MKNIPAPHTANTIVFTCIDDRLQPHITTLIQSQPGSAFHAALAGGGAAFTVEPDAQVALKQIVAAYNINQVIEIYLQSHLDCGAYRLAGVTFASPEAEVGRLYADLDIAAAKAKAALILAGAPTDQLQIYTQVITLDGQVLPKPAGPEA